ncbi:hypothetical protein T4A_8530 [Trichinella pseudospiralis]|uniref:Uncharacterized protein n=1 Tax=Trichinella pseudospiralis TaxID=6337 RepID=A0A0V1EE51_TRIPS|nr:hypothetical protein T4A_8530 [Trichinella pseudospiralis]KRY89626.1 hypothetical protein T4D_16968 [Trichinella pseudospiralis]KRZ42226.1 hypothetical protein T4C_12929 [Trichinella pseudospiralis]
MVEKRSEIHCAVVKVEVAQPRHIYRSIGVAFRERQPVRHICCPRPLGMQFQRQHLFQQASESVVTRGNRRSGLCLLGVFHCSQMSQTSARQFPSTESWQAYAIHTYI